MTSLFEVESATDRLLHLIELLLTLSRDMGREPIASVAYEGTVNRSKVERLQRVLSYLDKHWEETITLSEVAQVAALHPQSLSRFFGQHLGLSFQEYLLQLRVSHAARLLIETGRTISDIAFSCGFNNLSNFNAQFKRIKGRPPRSFRKQGAA